MILDDDDRRRWPDRALQAVIGWKQGHLIERPQLNFVFSRVHPIHAAARDAVAGEREIATIDTCPYGLITTQTCDVVEERPKPREPWLQVAPVYPVSGGDRSLLPQLRKDKVGHLVLLDPPDLGQDQAWVVDLRIEVPTEKGILVDRAPIEAFRDHEGYKKLAQRLAARRERPALHPDITAQITGPLRKWLDDLDDAEAEKVHEPVEELRLDVGGTELQPSSAQLLVIVKRNEELDEEARERWEEWWDHASDSLQAAGSSVALLGNQYVPIDELSAQVYKRSAPLDLRFLSL